MADAARRWTDKQLAEIEKNLKQTYQDAQAEMKAKWDAYMRKGQARLDALYNAYLTAPADKKADALKRYQSALQAFTLQNKWYQDMVNQMTYQMATVNQRAIAYINGNMFDIYLNNYNQKVPGLENVGIRFDMADAATVRRMVLDGTVTLPKKRVDVPKDMAWNTKYINNAVLQGILQGESMDDIAKRIFVEIMEKTDWTKGDRDSLIKRNWIAARRTARTLVTGAENRGRLDRYRGLEEEGAVMHKIWIATPDGRTRDWHIDLDGQEVPVNEMFVDGHGNELEYPGDPGAEPETVYNCRCSMRSECVGIRGKHGFVPMYREPHNGLHQEQMEKEKEKRYGTS